jgi:hypothetical protein
MHVLGKNCAHDCRHAGSSVTYPFWINGRRLERYLMNTRHTQFTGAIQIVRTQAEPAPAQRGLMQSGGRL